MMNLKKIIYLLLSFQFLLYCNCNSTHNKIKDLDGAFELIRKTSNLELFIKNMPKGGELHHHFAGAIYPELMLKWAIEDSLFLDLRTYKLYKNSIDKSLICLKNLNKLRDSSMIKEQIYQNWSIKDFIEKNVMSHDFFFNTFDKFIAVIDKHQLDGILYLREKAIEENLSYIETMFNTVGAAIKINNEDKLDKILSNLGQLHDSISINQILNNLIFEINKKGGKEIVKNYNQSIEKLISSKEINDSKFNIRFLNHCFRINKPISFFIEAYLNFLSANTSPNIVGVNILAPEHNKIATEDFWLHIYFFKYLGNLFPKVKIAMHAGELTPRIVKPKDLLDHIYLSVFLSKAQRIGHGVDIANENNNKKLLNFMKYNKIPVEINLSSNEFILKIINEKHPFQLYLESGVPLVISTDDAGVLRTTISEQYLELTQRYSFVKYSDIKEMVKNSILYSFIKESKIKEQILVDLNNRFIQFEKNNFSEYLKL